ncbi:MAG: hypothetical protein US96_C0002G0013 [Candidatus Woesebacteria bacterium GW2011_GWB1_38_5b]|uniref:Methyltransferase type 11 domain-containing protein n=1 Tax=Candidatus Woesebacteria bacterium GW2011_GWB1_38_5b TaxID=1618569 RepID=A0A0G0KK71_9BACT|nr:MAG: hypothetical protein US96_C0002G0013 [Candidatus Woesebacteria bacterium GW2011_GWB1_38_5b]
MILHTAAKIIKSLITRSYDSAFEVNIQNIEKSIKSTGPHNSILDVGCWDGKWTIHWAKIAKSKKIWGIEPTKKAANRARTLGVNTFSIPADTIKWPLPSNSIDCIVSNQVIEHLNDMDKFFLEASRVLKPGGVIITSTNNLSSVHNLLAMALGWAPFDLANCSYNSSSLGNPLSLHIHAQKCSEPSWTHKCVYTAYWLNSWQKIYGLIPQFTLGAGLYPFPASWGKVVKTYSAFITVVAKKVN